MYSTVVHPKNWSISVTPSSLLKPSIINNPKTYQLPPSKNSSPPSFPAVLHYKFNLSVTTKATDSPIITSEEPSATSSLNRWATSSSEVEIGSIIYKTDFGTLISFLFHSSHLFHTRRLRIDCLFFHTRRLRIDCLFYSFCCSNITKHMEPLPESGRTWYVCLLLYNTVYVPNFVFNMVRKVSNLELFSTKKLEALRPIR
ncbi:hypothetical protein LXL04_026680 [Taraxacum kok-saghyz]